MKLFILLLSLSSLTHAFECSKTTSGGTLVKVITSKKKAFVKFGSLKRVVKLHQDSWDGHAGGLITGKSFALKYSNHYGCIRMVTLITLNNFRNLSEVRFDTCKGGSTPDEVCLNE